jgi:GNAT superfamily N-acetyltransferase
MATTRLANERDQDRVLELLGQLWAVLPEPLEVSPERQEARARSFRRMIDSDRGAVLLAEDNGHVLGIISVSFNLAIRYPTAYAQIEELVVDEAARGKQAGALLVQAAIAEARRRGCDEIGLYPRDETRAFYEKLGFKYVGVELRQPL